MARVACCCAGPARAVGADAVRPQVEGEARQLVGSAGNQLELHSRRAPREILDVTHSRQRKRPG